MTVKIKIFVFGVLTFFAFVNSEISANDTLDYSALYDAMYGADDSGKSEYLPKLKQYIQTRGSERQAQEVISLYSRYQVFFLETESQLEADRNKYSSELLNARKELGNDSRFLEYKKLSDELARKINRAAKKMEKLELEYTNASSAYNLCANFTSVTGANCDDKRRYANNRINEFQIAKSNFDAEVEKAKDFKARRDAYFSSLDNRDSDYISQYNAKILSLENEFNQENERRWREVDLAISGLNDNFNDYLYRLEEVQNEIDNRSEANNKLSELLGNKNQSANEQMRIEGMREIYLEGIKALEVFTADLSQKAQAEQLVEEELLSKYGQVDDTGQGVIAVERFTKAAEQGLQQASFELSKLYRMGLIVKQSDQQFLKWLHKAAEDGPFSVADKDARFQLGIIYFQGVLVAKSPSKAIEYLILAHESGHHEASALLFQSYAFGQSDESGNVFIAKDTKEAIKYLDNATPVNPGYSLLLAKAYVYGVIPELENQPYPKNVEIGVYHLKTLSSRGMPQAEYELAKLYRDGIGVEKNQTKADELFAKATAAGYTGQ